MLSLSVMGSEVIEVERGNYPSTKMDLKESLPYIETVAGDNEYMIFFEYEANIDRLRIITDKVTNKYKRTFIHYIDQGIWHIRLNDNKIMIIEYDNNESLLIYNVDNNKT